MRRADRLFRIVQLLRKKRLVTATAIANELGVHVRTVYRDVRDLARSGVPVAGEAGVGYALTGGYELPPLMFTEDEVQALTLGARVVMAWGDEGLESAAIRALSKIEAVLTPRLSSSLEKTPLHAPAFHVSPRFRKALETLRGAIRDGRKVALGYVDKKGEPTTRTVVPVGLFFWGNTWSLAAYCELRQDYRSFRLDRMGECEVAGSTSPAEGRSLDAFLKSVGAPSDHERPAGVSDRRTRPLARSSPEAAREAWTQRGTGKAPPARPQRATSGKGGPGRAKK